LGMDSPGVHQEVEATGAADESWF